MNDWILYVVSVIAVVCLFAMLYFELKAGYSLRKALKDTLGFGVYGKTKAGASLILSCV